MGRPSVPAIERLANQLWLAKLLADWQNADEREGKRFTLTGVARALLSVNSGEGTELSADRERLQALTTIQRTGSNPKECRRFFPSGTAPLRIDPGVVEVTAEVVKRRRPQTHARNGRYFRIDAVARGEEAMPGSAAWHRPLFIRILAPPALGRDETRALLALELAKLGYVRSESLVRAYAKRRYTQGSLDPEVISAELWSRALDPLEHHGSLESLGVLALLLHEQRISFASEAICHSVSDALFQAMIGLLTSEGLSEFISPLERHIYERLWRQRWQLDVDDEGPDSSRIPVSMRRWLARCRRIPWQERLGGLPDFVAESDLADQTIEAMRAAVARAEHRGGKGGAGPTHQALEITGVLELRNRIKKSRSD